MQTDSSKTLFSVPYLVLFRTKAFIESRINNEKVQSLVKIRIFSYVIPLTIIQVAINLFSVYFFVNIPHAVIFVKFYIAMN